MPISLRWRDSRPTWLASPTWTRAVYAESALGGIGGALTGGTVLTGLLLWSGASLFEIGLLSSVTTGGGLLVMLAGRLQRRVPSHKRLTQLAWSTAWILWLPLGLLLAYFAASGRAGGGILPPLVLTTVFLVAGFGGIGNVFWNYWVARIVPRIGRGSFLASRARALNLAGLFAFPLIGIALDASKAAHGEAIAFAGLLCATVALAAVRFGLLQRIPAAREIEPLEDVSARAAAPALSARRYTVYTVLWQIGVQFGAPFFQVYLLQRLGLSFTVLMNLQVLSQIIPILTLGWWGRVIDRVGVRRPLVVCSIGKALVPVCYLASTPDVWWPVVIAYAITVLDAGLTVANNATLTQLAEGRGGSARVARVSLLTSLAAGATPIAAGALVAVLLTRALDALTIVFVLSAIGRAVSGLVLASPGLPRINLAPTRART